MKQFDNRIVRVCKVWRRKEAGRAEEQIVPMAVEAELGNDYLQINEAHRLRIHVMVKLGPGSLFH